MLLNVDWGDTTIMARSEKNFVNLDALLPRADLFARPEEPIVDTKSLRITDLEPGLIYGLLRKPDFQRETANWTPQQVVDLVQTFSKSDIIPAIILWQSGSVFVVDGAHRLSALLGWVHNDFGAGEKSLAMFNGKIPVEQREAHDRTSALIAASVGPWAEYREKHRILSLKELPVQWIEGRTPEQAASAFIRINQGGTIIDPLEIRILLAARSALSVATRVIARGGAGHPYWKHFSDADAIQRTPALGSEIHSLLYTPKLELPIKTLEVPLAGIGYGPGVIRLAFDLVALANNLQVPDSSRKAKPTDPSLAEDPSGTITMQYLKKTKRSIQQILSTERHSLGLHPALYFYTEGGNFQPSALLNVMAWVSSLENRGRIDLFRRVRGDFEELLIDHPELVKPAVHHLGSGTRNRPKALKVLDKTIELLGGGKDKAATWAALIVDFPHLMPKAPLIEDGEGSGQLFSTTAKSAITMAGLASVARCPLCRGLLHREGQTADHKEKRANGGSSHSRNGRWVHPICNSNRDKDEFACAKVSV